MSIQSTYVRLYLTTNEKENQDPDEEEDETIRERGPSGRLRRGCCGCHAPLQSCALSWHLASLSLRSWHAPLSLTLSSWPIEQELTCFSHLSYKVLDTGLRPPVHSCLLLSVACQSRSGMVCAGAQILVFAARLPVTTRNVCGWTLWPRLASPPPPHLPPLSFRPSHKDLNPRSTNAEPTRAFKVLSITCRRSGRHCCLGQIGGDPVGFCHSPLLLLPLLLSAHQSRCPAAQSPRCPDAPMSHIPNCPAAQLLSCLPQHLPSSTIRAAHNTGAALQGPEL
jgi:hypothetical protein